MTNVIQETEKHIKRIFPQTQDLDIKVTKDGHGKFVSKIHLRTSSRILHAMKSDPSLRRSLDKTFHAILSQVKRIKDKRKKKLHELRIG